jgi:hypothetical protein
LGVRDQEVWIKAWFDGDYNAIPGLGKQSQSDTETTHVQITRGRLTAIERVDGPPSGSPALRQEILAEAQLQTPDGQAWITPLQDLHLIDWESDSTASVLGGGGPRVGRVVGWAYAKVRDPSLSTRQKTSKPDRPLASDSASLGMPNDGDDANTDSSSSTTIKATSTDTQPPAPTSAVDSTAPPLPVHPCRVCSWGRAVFLFLIVWMVCSVGWAFLAVTPLLIRCFLARFAVNMLPAYGDRRLLESLFVLIFGVCSFLYVAWNTLLGCGVPEFRIAG